MMENAIRNQLANQLITEQITRSELEEALIKISDEEMLTIERPIHSQLVTACHSIIYQLNGIEMPSDHSLTESVIRVSRKIARRSRIQTSL